MNVYGNPATPPAYQMPEADWQKLMYHHARRTSAAVTFIAWIIGIGVLFSIIIGIVIGVQVAKVDNNLTHSSVSTSCQSQGGTIPGC
jgi:hypothetical protein